VRRNCVPAVKSYIPTNRARSVTTARGVQRFPLHDHEVRLSLTTLEVGSNSVDLPLKDHISLLEQRIRELNVEVMRNSQSRIELNRIEAEIRAAELALAHYRKALELEKRLARMN
jgi:hypothetical protein